MFEVHVGNGLERTAVLRIYPDGTRVLIMKETT
jgi:hypothetical protein